MCPWASFILICEAKCTFGCLESFLEMNIIGKISDDSKTCMFIVTAKKYADLHGGDKKKQAEKQTKQKKEQPKQQPKQEKKVSSLHLMCIVEAAKIN